MHNGGLGKVIPGSSHVRFAKPSVFQKSFIDHQPNLGAKQLLNTNSAHGLPFQRAHDRFDKLGLVIVVNQKLELFVPGGWKLAAGIHRYCEEVDQATITLLTLSCCQRAMAPDEQLDVH